MAEYPNDSPAGRYRERINEGKEDLLYRIRITKGRKGLIKELTPEYVADINSGCDFHGLYESLGSFLDNTLKPLLMSLKKLN